MWRIICYRSNIGPSGAKEVSVGKYDSMRNSSRQFPTHRHNQMPTECPFTNMINTRKSNSFLCPLYKWSAQFHLFCFKINVNSSRHQAFPSQSQAGFSPLCLSPSQYLENSNFFPPFSLEFSGFPPQNTAMFQPHTVSGTEVLQKICWNRSGQWDSSFQPCINRMWTDYKTSQERNKEGGVKNRKHKRKLITMSSFKGQG